MKKGVTMYQKLKTWCKKNGVDYRTAYIYMHRHEISEDQTIEYYSKPRVTLLQMCMDAELPYNCVCNYKRRHKLSNEDALRQYAELQRNKITGKSTAKVLAEQHGIAVDKIYKRMYHKRCGAEQALKDVLAYERKKHGKVRTEPKGLPQMLTRAWV